MLLKTLNTTLRLAFMGRKLRCIKIAGRAVPLGLVCVLLISGIGLSLLAYVWSSVTIPFEVKEPLEILSYPSGFSLFPGETVEFNVTVKNHASINYSVMFEYRLNNSDYQTNYVRFSDETFNVGSGVQTLTTWLFVEPNAPPIQASLTIDLLRIKPCIHDLPDHTANFTFTWGPDAQNIVDGTFRIEISAWFENHTSPWDNTTIVMFNWIVRVYDDDYSSGDTFGFVYDHNHNGIIDLGYTDHPSLFFADNSKAGAPALLKDGGWAEAEVPRTQANVCRYDSEKGYTFGPFGGPKDYYAYKFGDGPTYIPLFISFSDRNPPYTERARTQVTIQFKIYLD